MTLGLYLTRRLAGTFGVIAAVFIGILYLFELVEMMRRFGGGEVGMRQILWLAALRAPTTFYQVLPLLAILSAMALFLALARSSELVVIRAAGRSAVRMLVEPFVATLLFGALVVAALNPVVAAATRLYQAQSQAITAPDLVLQVAVDGTGLWLRQGDSLGQTVIRAGSVEGDGLTFRDTGFIAFDADTGAPVARIEAALARLGPGAWELHEAKRWDLTAANPEREAQSYDRLALSTDLTPERIRDSFARAGAVSIWALPELIASLERAGLATRALRVQLQSELALPVLMAAMMLVGTVLSMRHSRAGGAGTRIMVTVIAGFSLFFLRNFAQILGENGQVPLALAVWTPPLATILLALGVLLHLEDG
jgi:lipopolysaccharide export system permease protein